MRIVTRKKQVYNARCGAPDLVAPGGDGRELVGVATPAARRGRVVARVGQRGEPHGEDVVHLAQRVGFAVGLPDLDERRAVGDASDILARHLPYATAFGVDSSFIAKLASKAAKPVAKPDGVSEGAGVVEVAPGAELEFLHPLPVKALWGGGSATLEKLTRIGVRTVRDLSELDERTLMAAVGKAHGQHLHRLSWAIDDRPVEVDRELKSIGHEETFASDRHTHDELRRELVRLADGVAGRMRARNTGARTFALKVRFAGFHTITRSITLPSPVDTAHAIIGAVTPLLAAVDPTPGVRLLGVSASNFGEAAEQLSLDAILDDAPAAPGEWQVAEQTVDAIRERFGSAAIGPASAVSRKGLRLVRKGAQQWGPDHDQNQG